MSLILDIAWLSMTLFRYGGVIVVFAGVALFGAYFIAGNARSHDGKVPADSWKGPGPKKGIRIIAVGALMLLTAYLISLFMPNGR